MFDSHCHEDEKPHRNSETKIEDLNETKFAGNYKSQLESILEEDVCSKNSRINESIINSPNFNFNKSCKLNDSQVFQLLSTTSPIKKSTFYWNDKESKKFQEDKIERKFKKLFTLKGKFSTIAKKKCILIIKL